MPTRIKLLFAGLILFFVLLGAGTFMPFLPSREVMTVSAAVSLLAGCRLRRPLQRAVDFLNQRFVPKRYVFLIKPFVLFFSVLFIYEALAKPVPYLANLAVGKPASVVTRVSAKDTSVGKTVTRYSIHTEIPNWFVIGQGLPVSEREYERLREGDNVRLDGRRSFLGLSVKRITILD